MVRKKKEPSKNYRLKLIHLHMYQGSPLVPIFRTLTRCLRRHSLVGQDHFHTIHPAQPRSPSYPPSTYFNHQRSSGHTVLIHSFHICKLSQFSLICFLSHSLSIPAHRSSSSFPILSIRDTPTKLLKHFISRSFTFLLSALRIPHISVS